MIAGSTREEVEEPPVQEEANFELRDYQQSAVDWMWGKFKDPKFRGCLLADNMGTGKTGLFHQTNAVGW